MHGVLLLEGPDPLGRVGSVTVGLAGRLRRHGGVHSTGYAHP